MRLPSHSPLLSFVSEDEARHHVCQPSCSPFVQLLASASHSTIGNRWKLKLFQSVDEAFAALSASHSSDSSLPVTSNSHSSTHTKSHSMQSLSSGRTHVPSSSFTRKNASSSSDLLGSSDSQDGNSSSLSHIPFHSSFHSPADDGDGYTVKVPGHWQLQVPGDAPIYTNITYIIPPPSPSFPPSLPAVNPSALYTHSFIISPSWSNRRVVLRFDGVDRWYHYSLTFFFFTSEKSLSLPTLTNPKSSNLPSLHDFLALN